MEYLNGLSFAEHLKEIKEEAFKKSVGVLNGYEINLLPQEDVIGLIMPIILAVKHLHDRKVIHKDICPRNFRYSSEGVLKMIDLHEAKCQDFTH